MIEEYRNEQKPNDGDFYLKIQTYKGIFGNGKNQYFERRWWARLAAISNSTDPKRNLQRLLNHRIFARAFDAFHCIPALYSGLRLSAIGKMITLGCHEVRREYWLSIASAKQIIGTMLLSWRYSRILLRNFRWR